MLPDFDGEGNLPAGIHPATEEEVFSQFATTSARRQWLGEQLRSILTLAKSTGKLFRVFLWGSFVTGKAVLHLWLDTCQFGRDFKRRGIVEVVVS